MATPQYNICLVIIVIGVGFNKCFIFLTPFRVKMSQASDNFHCLIDHHYIFIDSNDPRLKR